MNPLEIIQAASIGINALLQLIGSIKAQSGLTDEQIAEQFTAHGEATKTAIKGYLEALNTPPAA